MIACFGDLHIEALERHIPDSSARVLSTLKKSMKREASRGVAAFVQLGDSFDSPYPDQHYIREYTKVLRQFPDIPFHILMGNHDFADIKHNSLRLIKYFCDIGFINGTVYTKPKIVKIDGESYFFCPHPYVVDPPKSVRYCFGHFGFDGAKSDTGYTLKSKNAPKGRWILGDYHTPQKGKTYIYAGSLCQTKWHESREKGYIRIEESPRFIQIEPDILLDRTTVDTAADLAELDPNVYWSVNFGRKVKLPPDWSQKYPHIVRHHTEKSSSKRAKILMKKVATDDPLEGFADYLRNEGLNDKEIRYSMRKFLGR